VASKIRLLEANIADLRRQQDAAQGRQRRAIEKQMAELNDMLDDLHAFAERIDAILQRGYTPHTDDGVLINMAPRWELLSSWQAEPKSAGRREREAITTGRSRPWTSGLGGYAKSAKRTNPTQSLMAWPETSLR
jgi:hypothetical protein